MASDRDAPTPASTRNEAGNGGGILTEKIIAGARKGSAIDLTLIATTFETSTKSITPQAVDALLCHLRADAVPKLERRRTLTATDLFRDPRYRKQLQALGGISAIPTRSDAANVKLLLPLLRTTWSDAFPWMQFLFNIYSPSKSDPNLQALVEGKDPVSVLLLGVLNAFLGVQKAYSANLVTETPGAVRLATRLWIREGLDGSKLMQPKSLTKVALLVFQVVLGDKPTSKALDEVIEGADAEGEPVSKRLPSLLQSYMRFTLDFGGDLANVTEVIETLVRMTSSNHSHPVSQAFVSQGMVPFVVKLITSLDATLPRERSLENAPLLNPMFFHGFQYICNSFYASASVQHVVQAIDAGFLEVFVAWGIALPSLTAKEHDHVLHLFSDSLMPLLVYLPVLSASERALKRMDEQSTTQKPFHKSTEKAKDMWLKFVWTVEKRFKLSLASMTINDVVNPRSKRTFMCDNCCKSYPYSTLKACAACGLVSYCSKACQIQHWKEKGHRERCKSLRGDANVVSYKNLLNKSGKSASPRQVVTFICDLARSEALEHMDALVALAKEQLPDVAIEDVGVEVNYGEFPSTFKVFARNECIQARQALSKGVTEEINNDFPPESREFVGEMLRRSKKDQVQHRYSKRARATDVPMQYRGR